MLVRCAELLFRLCNAASQFARSEGDNAASLWSASIARVEWFLSKLESGSAGSPFSRTSVPLAAKSRSRSISPEPVRVAI